MGLQVVAAADVTSLVDRHKQSLISKLDAIEGFKSKLLSEDGPHDGGWFHRLQASTVRDRS